MGDYVIQDEWQLYPIPDFHIVILWCSCTNDPILILKWCSKLPLGLFFFEQQITLTVNFEQELKELLFYWEK